jgi:predicted AAA+ superfamily ATPase
VLSTFPDALYIDLLDPKTFRELSSDPRRLSSIVKAHTKKNPIIIDEVQKLPSLLDEVRSAIEKFRRQRFILPGSSARKLKRGGGNLLGVRAVTVSFHPLASCETGHVDLTERLLYGSLPPVFNVTQKLEFLHAYLGTYLREEIAAEGVTRNIEGFSRFLDMAALSSGQMLNFTEIGADSGIAPRTVQNYYQVLEDTLIGYLIPPYRVKLSRKAYTTSKFYLFDTGVVNALLNRESLSHKTKEFGELFEHMICSELRAYLDYNRVREPPSFRTSHTKDEVDFVIGKKIAIEVKSKSLIHDNDLSGLRAFREASGVKNLVMVSLEEVLRQTNDGINILPLNMFLEKLWNHKLFKNTI